MAGKTSLGPSRGVGAGVAAMEPGRDGREDMFTAACAFASGSPQWSPAVMAGKTPVRVLGRRYPDGAAMEPGRDGREDLVRFW